MSSWRSDWNSSHHICKDICPQHRWRTVEESWGESSCNCWYYQKNTHSFNWGWSVILITMSYVPLFTFQNLESKLASCRELHIPEKTPSRAAISQGTPSISRETSEIPSNTNGLYDKGLVSLLISVHLCNWPKLCRLYHIWLVPYHSSPNFLCFVLQDGETVGLWNWTQDNAVNKVLFTTSALACLLLSYHWETKQVFLNHKYENALFSGAESYLMPPSLPLSEKGSAFTCISTLLLCLWTETATYCFTILLEICIVFCRCTLS